MAAERRTESWNEGWGDRNAVGCTSGMVAEKAADRAAENAADGLATCTDTRPAIGQGTCKPPARQDREGRLVEALLECTTIAGLFALLFALFVLFGAAHTLAP
ncbi:hypothetical protein [Azospirillum ramasamyi]|uniref:Uncharacterized protein n=1 Tax=Azospirillum ramasamyi TaxID=682998 RepID=A0A2U9S9M9_9PROT|nr:hypothetical protein [Azospirillum ramasamyi]AWU94618.1 hypothetical protein DM194_10295 [Azospirillum ramasamyi]